MIWHKYQIEMWDAENKEWRIDYRFYRLYISIEEKLFDIPNKRKSATYLGTVFSY